MTLTLDAALVLVAAATLLAAAFAVATWRRMSPASAAAVATFGLGLGALFTHVPGRGIGPTLPLVPLTGLTLGVLLGVLPRRHRDPDRIAALLVLAAVHVLLAAIPLGPPVAALWLLESAATAAVLPRGPARRLALPYLVLAGAIGAVGLGLDDRLGGGLVILAAAIRMGIPPFQGWVLGAYTRAPTTWAVALASPMAALSLVLRVPTEAAAWAGGAGVLALTLASVAAAGMALVQTELGRAVGLLTVSVAANVLIGVLDSDPTGQLGGLMMWGLSGASLVGLGGVTAALRSREGEVRVDRFGGRFVDAPALGALFLVFGLASVGAPGTADFISGELVLHGGLARDPAALLLFITAVSLQGYAVMHLFFRLFGGPPGPSRLPDVSPRERLALGVLAGILVLGGIAPQLWIDGWLRAVVP